MNKSEAIEAMRSGKKVTHNTFISGEYVTMKDESMVDEAIFLMQMNSGVFAVLKFLMKAGLYIRATVCFST